jgi:hypothetical protein
MKIFKNIRRYGIFRVPSHVVVFPCTDTIAWILKHIDLGRIYVCNSRRDPIALFWPQYVENIYHIEKRTKKLDKKLLIDLEHTTKELYPRLCKLDKQFKLRPKGGYPMTMLRRPY